VALGAVIERHTRGTGLADHRPSVGPTVPALRISSLIAAVLFVATIGLAGCVKGQMATDVGDPGSPFGPTPVDGQHFAYIQDIKPILDHDCLECHSSRDARGNYSVASYADVLNGQKPGNAQSSLVVTCSPGGSMYGYFTVDPTTRATMVFRWMVVDNAALSR
jgi:hypothetical protein